jgi:two-component system nitrate/nitrite response regulator NarL
MNDRALGTIVPLAICDTQPLIAEGVRCVLSAHSEFEVVAVTSSLDELRERTVRLLPKLVILDKSAGAEKLLQWIEESRHMTGTILWGHSISEPEALRLIQSGIRGILRKTVGPTTLLECLRAVNSGQYWMEDSVVRGNHSGDRYPRSELTRREQQVMALVEIGLRNRDIAHELGIRPGTVKIHLKHIFEKTGVRGRYGLALNGLKDRGLLSVARGSDNGS